MKNCKCEEGAWEDGEMLPICDMYIEGKHDGICSRCEHDAICHQQLTADAQSPQHYAKAHDMPGMLRRIEELEVKMKHVTQTMEAWTTE